MLRIIEVSIERYRSIIKLEYRINGDNNIIALCGQNNVGKTNTLRAINIFFNPDLYVQEIDIPRIKNATGGAATHPKITIHFYNDKTQEIYCIARNFSKITEQENGLSGTSYKIISGKKKDKKVMTKLEIKNVLDKIEFAYIESINVLMPELVDKLTNDVIDVQYDKARFSETKKVLKESYDTYIDGLNEILEKFAADISSTFQEFKDDWSVKFDIPKNSDTFRNLISDDVKLQLDDCGSMGIEEKGAGLQRLATILLQFEMLSRMHSKKQIIVCIDEPDVYLHEGIQKKLIKFFDDKAKTMQLFITTHSKIFINAYNMKNVFLLSANNYKQYSARKKKEISVTETVLVDIKDELGYKKICEHLGIEQKIYEPLERKNILVEGKCDKKYIEELCKFFNLQFPNIISMDGADKAEKYLDFYNSYYYSLQCGYKPIIKIILDNDFKGREVCRKINAKKVNYNYIEVKCIIVQNYLGDSNISLEHNNTNNEIEDFIYPELMCFLINSLLPKMHLLKINEKKMLGNIKKTSFKSKGILALCEYEKNERNPENGGKISFTSSGEKTNRFKDSLAETFDIQANIKLLELLEMCKVEHPFVEAYLRELCEM